MKVKQLQSILKFYVASKLCLGILRKVCSEKVRLKTLRERRLTVLLAVRTLQQKIRKYLRKKRWTLEKRATNHLKSGILVSVSFQHQVGVSECSK